MRTLLAHLYGCYSWCPVVVSYVDVTRRLLSRVPMKVVSLVVDAVVWAWKHDADRRQSSAILLLRGEWTASVVRTERGTSTYHGDAFASLRCNYTGTFLHLFLQINVIFLSSHCVPRR